MGRLTGDIDALEAAFEGAETANAYQFTGRPTYLVDGLSVQPGRCPPTCAYQLPHDMAYSVIEHQGTWMFHVLHLDGHIDTHLYAQSESLYMPFNYYYDFVDTEEDRQ
jgi:hypothetical protein